MSDNFCSSVLLLSVYRPEAEQCFSAQPPSLAAHSQSSWPEHTLLFLTSSRHLSVPMPKRWLQNLFYPLEQQSGRLQFKTWFVPAPKSWYCCSSSLVLNMQEEECSGCFSAFTLCQGTGLIALVCFCKLSLKEHLDIFPLLCFPGEKTYCFIYKITKLFKYVNWVLFVVKSHNNWKR